MKKHQIIRSISVLLFIALVFNLSNLDTGLINSNRIAPVSCDQYDWHMDLTSELELQQFQLESEYFIITKMLHEAEEPQKISSFVVDRECQTISSSENNPHFSNTYIYMPLPFN